MRSFTTTKIIIGLLAASLFFLLLYEVVFHHHMLLHMAAVPLEVLLAIFIIEKLLERNAIRDKKRQLMFIKSYLFRSEMRSLFLQNFFALKSPDLNMAKIRAASLSELEAMRAAAEKVDYHSPEALEPVAQEYAKARDVWVDFMNRAITYDFEAIFKDMIEVLHFVSDVSTCKKNHPNEIFMLAARRNPRVLERARKIMSDGIRRFLEYAIELKQDHPHMFDDMMADYALSEQVLLDPDAAGCP